MPIGDYQKEEKAFSALPKGQYVVEIDNIEGDLTSEKPNVNFRYQVTEGEYKGRKIFKRYYLTPRTVEKFIPWQFGIMGIWSEVKEAEDFSKAVEIVIDQAGPMLNRVLFSADVEVETYQGKDGAEKERNNMVLVQHLGEKELNGDEFKFDKDEEVPF